MTHDQRNEFFYSGPSKFKDWPEGVKLGIGFNLSDARYRSHPYYTATIKGATYTISREKAEFFGKKFNLGAGKMPHIIPINYFEVKYEDFAGNIPYTALHQVDREKKLSKLF